MAQDEQSGAAGDAFGRDMAPKIARAIGATMVRPGSNEAALNGARVVIKSGGPRTRSVGVSKKMLSHLSAVVAAFQTTDGAFDVFLLPVEIYKNHMIETRSKGPSAGRVGVVTKSVFTSHGERILTVGVSPALQPIK